jgi:transposase
VATVEDRTGAEVRFYGTIENTPDALRKLSKKLSQAGQQLHACYEAGPCRYNVQRHLTRLGHRCDVMAPSLIPRKSGERVKTDRRDAMMSAQTLRAGQLTEVWVPDQAHEAMRDLVRLRSQAMRDLRKTRQHLLRSCCSMNGSRHTGTGRRCAVAG